jgi:acyl carrier protein
VSARTRPVGPCTADDVVTFAARAVADLIGVEAASVDPDAPIDSLALDSLEAVILTGDLSAWLGWEVEETLPWQVDTLRALAEIVAADDLARQGS